MLVLESVVKHKMGSNSFLSHSNLYSSLFAIFVSLSLIGVPRYYNEDRFVFLLFIFCLSLVELLDVFQQDPLLMVFL